MVFESNHWMNGLILLILITAMLRQYEVKTDSLLSPLRLISPEGVTPKRFNLGYIYSGFEATERGY